LAIVDKILGVFAKKVKNGAKRQLIIFVNFEENDPILQK
jgi:hypothetical protein